MKSRLAFLICLGVSVGLIVAGFIVPPTGIVDGSVLTSVGELLGFATLSVTAHAIDKAIDKGLDTTFKHGQTEVHIDNPDKTADE